MGRRRDLSCYTLSALKNKTLAFSQRNSSESVENRVDERAR